MHISSHCIKQKRFVIIKISGAKFWMSFIPSFLNKDLLSYLKKMRMLCMHVSSIINLISKILIITTVFLNNLYILINIQRDVLIIKKGYKTS